MRYTNTDTQTVTAADFGIKVPGSWAVDGTTDDRQILADVSADGASISFTLKPDLTFDSQSASIAVTFIPEDVNYQMAMFTATVTLLDKAAPR